MKRSFFIVIGACICVLSSYAYVANVAIQNVNGGLYKESTTETYNAFIAQFPAELFLTNEFSIDSKAFWTNGSVLRLAGSDERSGDLTIKSVEGTIISYYNFEGRNSCNKKGALNNGDGVSCYYCPTVTVNKQTTTLHRSNGNNNISITDKEYNSQSLCISATNKGGNRAELSNFSFRVKVPELLQANQSESVDLPKIAYIDAGKGTIREKTLTFILKDPIVSNTSTLSEIQKYYSIALNNSTGNKWEIVSVSLGNVENSGKATMNITVRYTDASVEQLGNFNTTLVVRPINNVVYDGVSPKELVTVVNISVGVLTHNTLEWNIPLINYIDDVYGIGSGTDYCYKNANSTALLGAPFIVSQQPETGYTEVVRIENAQLKMVGEGTATLHYVQPADGDYAASSMEDITISVVKKTPTFSINNGDFGRTLYVNKSYSDLIVSDNTETALAFLVPDADDSYFLKVENNVFQTGSNTKSNVRIHISQLASKHYYAHEEDIYFDIKSDPRHVGVLCNNITEELFKDPNFCVNYATLNSAGWGGVDGIKFGGTGGGSGSSYNDEVILHFTGTPDVITWSTNGGGTFTFSYSPDNTLNSYTVISNNASLPSNAQYIKIAYTGTGKDGLAYVTGLCITEKVGIDVEPQSLLLTAIENIVSVGVLSVHPSNLKTVTLEINSEEFELVGGTHEAGQSITLDYHDGLGVDCSPIVPVQVRYIGDYASAVGKTAQVNITDGNGHTATVNVKIQSVETNEYGVPKSIYASMATATGIETGTEHKTNNNYPYHIKRAVDLTGAFAAGAACFDKLYIFGVTKGYTSAEQTTETTTINKYSKTPCYVYTKNADHYDFEQYVDNMNSDTKSIGVNVSATGQKLYFTGWCPYASAGYLSSDIGVFHIKGGAGATVDIYLDSCYLYARSKTTNYKYDEDVTQAKTKFGNYPTGSGGVFVFETTSTKSTEPFCPTIHLRGENILRSTHGNRVYVSFLGVTKTATQCSSPLHMYTTSTDQYESLTIDDKWLTSADGAATENVNGSLQLTKLTSNSPSIDLGNERSVVNFNGGRVHLQNSLPLSTAYSSTLAISWRSYSQYGLTIYGIGTDQASGRVNFNDGTISATPIDQSSWNNATDYIGYYWDNESMKCPKETYINGGSYNCNIWACSSFDDKGSSVTDMKGTALCKQRIKATGTLANGMAEFEFPFASSGEEGSLRDYYSKAGFLYGQNSITADDKDSVNLMLPCSYIGQEAVVSKVVVPWAMCVPALAAGAGNSASKTFGGDLVVKDDAAYEVNNFLWTQLDDNMQDIVSSGDYKSPEYGATISFRKDANKSYSQITNSEDYAIQNELNVIISTMADRWMTFTAPFDIKKMYILESYPDSVLKTLSRDEALQLQATANVDFSYFLAFYVLGVEPMSTSPLSGLYGSWLRYEYGRDTLAVKDNGTGILQKNAKGQFCNYTQYEKQYRGKRELIPYNGTNAAKANFYLYESGDTWQLSDDGSSVVPQWDYVSVGSDNVVLKKGKTYSLLFPYCVGCWTEDEKIFGRREYWDYWTGKLLILVGTGPQTINGKNAQSALLSTTPAANMVSISGNSTFADFVSDNSNLWIYSNTIGDESFSKTQSSEEPISPVASFLINGIQSKAGATPKRINIRSGVVTYGNETATTGVPTIAGGRTLIVNSVDGGLTVVPVVPQQVGIYGSAGQLIASDYMTDETTLSLPAGIYMVRGEKETAKVIVR